MAVGDGTITILLSSEDSPAASVQAEHIFYELAGRVTESFRF